jgi:UDP-2,3-diacylglucosamine hydrolase
MDIAVSESRYLNLGEWMNFSTYGEFDGSTMSLKVWDEDGEKDFEGIKE